MKYKIPLISLGVLVVIGVIIFAAMHKNTKDKMSAQEGSMESSMKKTEGESMMQNENSSMTKDEDKMMDNKPSDAMQKDDAMKKEDTMMQGDAMVKESPSSYIDYSQAVLADAKLAQKSGRKVVLFFHAGWCPFCIEADKDFKANINTDKFPKNLTLIKTDYDSNAELKRKYGITTQHTFVQIDSNGDQITKWISGATPELSKNIK